MEYALLKPRRLRASSGRHSRTLKVLTGVAFVAVAMCVVSWGDDKPDLMLPLAQRGVSNRVQIRPRCPLSTSRGLQIPARAEVETTEKTTTEPWQVTADTLINVDATQEERISAIRSLLDRRQDVTETLRSAISKVVSDRDIDSAKDILYPQGTEARKVVDGLDAVRRQLVDDILPEITKPTNIRAALRSRPAAVAPPSSLNATKVADGIKSELESIRSEIETVQKNPELVRERLNSAVEEGKNVFRRTPTGLEMPNYTVLAKGEGYEIREYEPYTVVSTPMGGVTSADETAKTIAESGKAFNTLASYIFGANEAQKAMQMTAPVELTMGSEDGEKEMAFVVPSEFAEETPLPTGEQPISIKKVPGQIVAVREFPGFATDKEISFQKEQLLSQLIASNDYVVADASSFRVLQWNPPYTLPWLRRNEVVTKVLSVAEVFDSSEEAAAAAPEEPERPAVYGPDEEDE